jgi:hypothetical protein
VMVGKNPKPGLLLYVVVGLPLPNPTAMVPIIRSGSRDNR